MEKSRMPMELVEQVRTLGTVLRMERSAHLRRAFALFLTKVLLPKKTGRSDFPDVSDLVEVERMILEGKHEWAENWLKEGEERGIKLGEARGIKLGEARGIKLGEERTKRENALRMLDKGFSVADVAECVNLSEAEVRRLAEETRQ
ncbi:MAG: hypothetical protein PHX00_10810 [Synergistaceae bacterium]|nr:hypothetical protein [Synergistaceae bacterium]